MLPDDSDAALVLAARGGDKEAFATVLMRHRPALLGLCRRALGDSLLVDDIAQEAALQAFLSLDRLRRPEQFGAWLCGIGLNICRWWLRRRGRDAWSWEALQGGYLVQEPMDAQPGPDEMAETADLVRRVRHAVSLLPRGQRAAVMLFYLSGLTYSETAAHLGIEIGAVKTRLHKARASLRKRLWAAWQENDMAAETDATTVPMRIADVWRMPLHEGQRQCLVLLEEAGGPRKLWFWIGPWEGEALALALEQVAAPRPMTFHFAARLLEAAGGRLAEVHINKLVENTFYAVAAVDGPGGTRYVDARPSDALNLAAITGVPIRVEADVIEQTMPAHLAFISEQTQDQAADEPGPDWLMAQKEFLRSIARGERTGGAAEIVAEISGP